MRSILFLSVMNGGAWGGSEEQWYRVALWMSQNGYKVSICVFDHENKKPRIDELKKAGCTVFLLPVKGLFKKFQQKAVLNKIGLKQYDLVFINQGGWKDVAHGVFKSLYKNLPSYVLSFHNYKEGAAFPANKTAILKNWITNAKLCVADSSRIFDMLEKEYQIQPGAKTVFYNPITFEVPELPAKYVTPTNDENWIIVMLAALDVERKAQDVLINALAKPEWKQRNWQLHLYGDGQDKELLENLVREKQLTGKAFLKGHSNNVKQVLANSHLLLQATHIDAMPISVTEAMAMARPCVVSIVGDMPDWINDEQNGFIAKQVTEEALHVTLENAWQKREEWKQMGTNAYKTFMEKYPQPYEEKFVQLLKQYA